MGRVGASTLLAATAGFILMALFHWRCGRAWVVALTDGRLDRPFRAWHFAGRAANQETGRDGRQRHQDLPEQRIGCRVSAQHG
jgi:hypothetical protein